MFPGPLLSVGHGHWTSTRHVGLNGVEVLRKSFHQGMIIHTQNSLLLDCCPIMPMQIAREGLLSDPYQAEWTLKTCYRLVFIYWSVLLERVFNVNRNALQSNFFCKLFISMVCWYRLAYCIWVKPEWLTHLTSWICCLDYLTIWYFPYPDIPSNVLQRQPNW